MRATVALLLLGELGVRLIASPPRMPPGDPFLIAHPEYGFVLAESMHHQYDVTERGFKGTRDWPSPRNNGELRIMVVGDSNACRLDGQDWPGMLGEALSAEPSRRRVFVADVSVPGWSSLNAARAAALEIPLFDPDVLIVSIGTNDPYPSALPDTTTQGRPDVPNRIVLHAERVSRLAAWLLFQTKWRRTAPAGTTPRLQPEESGDNIRAILAVSARARKLVVLPHYPVEHFGNHLDPDRAQSHREAIHAAASSARVTILDFRQELDGSDRMRFLEKEDTIHLNEAGSEMIASRLVEFLTGDGASPATTENPL